MKKITPSLDKIFRVFRKNYVLVPLEVFGSDPYKTLVSTILSARTKDEVTLEASKRLFKKARSLNELKNLDTALIEKLIYPVGFYKVKAKNLKKLALTTKLVPNTREGLLGLPGVGIKTANLVLNRAFNIPAIAVDTHVHRISNMLGLVKTSSPEETYKTLTGVLPKKYWSETNRLFVSIGRQYTSVKKLKGFLVKNGLIIS